MPISAHLHVRSQSKRYLAALGMLALAVCSPAQAVDGCKLLLCMAGNWQHISQCVPTVRQALADVVRGRVWPQCSMSGGSGSASQFVEPESCPEQYRSVSLSESNQPITYCPFSGVVQVSVAGQPWTRTWWSTAGDAVTEWLPAAKAAFVGSPDAMDHRFDSDHAAWVAAQGGG